MKRALSLFKWAGLIPLAGLTMGNQSCQQQAATPPRELRKLVDMGTIAAPPIMLPGGGSFDFGFVANQQMYGVLMNHAGFTTNYKAPVIMTSRGSGQVTLSQNDQRMMKAVMGKSAPDLILSKEASCMVNLPMFRMQGSINAFEMVGGGGLTLGFSPAGNHAVGGISGNFGIEYAQMDVTLTATGALLPTLLAAVNVNSTQTKTKIGLTLDLGMFSIGPSFYYQTPLAKVTREGLTKAAGQIKDKLKDQRWYTRVMANQDDVLSIVGGSETNLKKGDEVEIYNEIYHWSGEPCDSQYFGGAPVSPVALATVISVGEGVSFVQIIPGTQKDENAVVGAKVMISRMKEDIDAANAAAAAANKKP